MNTDSNNQTPKANELPNYYGESHGSIEHSLPSYSNATAASASALKDIPDKKIKNNEDDGDIIDRKFYLCSKHGSYEVTSFVSQDSREKYDLFKSSKSGTDTYSHALYLQRNGYAIPLLTTDHHTIASMHSIKYMSIYKFTPPPATEDRLFNLKKDRFKYCEITRERFKSYYKYEFQFTPDPTDKSKNFSIFMFHHNRYLIADLTPYKGKRLRWVGGDVFDFKVSYQYELHLLSNNQESLTDNLDSKRKFLKKILYWGRH